MYRVGIIGLGPVAIRKSQSEGLPAFQGKPVSDDIIQAGIDPSSPATVLGDPVLVSHAASLAKISEIQVVAVCDVSAARIKRFFHNWSDIWPGTRSYTDYSEMMRREELDLIAVCTPEHLHVEPVVAAAESGVKGILCEKPIATSLEDADRMIKACDNNNVVLNIEYTRRWSPLFLTVRQVLRSGAIGNVTSISGAFGGAQAWMFRSGSHLLDAMCFFSESDPEIASAHLEHGYDDWDRYRGSGGGNLTERDPGATGYVVFKNGVRCFYTCINSSPDFYREFLIVGNEGYISFPFNGEIGTLHTRSTVDPSMASSSVIQPESYRTRAIEAAYRELIENISSGTKSVSPAQESRKAVAIMMAFLKSHKEQGGLVKV